MRKIGSVMNRHPVKLRIFLMYFAFWCMFDVVLCTSASYCLTLAEHISLTNVYVGGLTTQDLRDAHSIIIDTVPWRNYTAGGLHRFLWGHSEEWYFKGSIPKDAALKDIMGNGYSKQEALKIYKKYSGTPGRALISRRIAQNHPSLTLKESEALADQVFYSHKMGDATTAEGKYMTPQEVKKAYQMVHYPSKHALSGINKLAWEKAKAQGTSMSSFVRQGVNLERLYIQKLIDSNSGYTIYNPAVKGFSGVVISNREYLVASSWQRGLEGAKKGYDVLVADDVYEKILQRHPEYSGKIHKMSSVTGRTESMQEIAHEHLKEIDKQLIEKGSISTKDKVLSMTKGFAKYAIPGVIMSVAENWGYIQDAYHGYEDVEKVMSRVAIDAAGYTASPMVVHAVLAHMPGSDVIGLFTRSGGAYYLGYFLYGVGKECYAYQEGDLTLEELETNLKGRAFGLITLPVMMIACKISAASGWTGVGLVVPLAIIGGGFMISRGQEWYENKQWEKTISLNDLRAFYGTDFVGEFSFLTPEKIETFLDPETRDTFLDPGKQATFLEPEKTHTMLNP